MGDENKSVLQILVELQDQVTDPLHKINDQFEDFSSGLGGIAMAAGEVFAGYEGLKTFIEPAAGIQESMTGFALASRTAGKELEGVNRQADELASTFAVKGGAESVVQSMTDLYKIFGGGELKEQAELAAKFSLVMGQDMPESTRLLAATVHDLGNSHEDTTAQMSKFANQIAVLKDRYFPSGQEGLTRLTQGMMLLGTMSKSFKIAPDQLMGALGESARLQLGGRMGPARGLVMILNDLFKKTKDGSYEMAQYGLQVKKTKDGELDLMATLQGLAAMSDKSRTNLLQHMSVQGRQVSLLIDDMKGLQAVTSDVTGSVNEMSEADQKRLGDFNANLKNLTNSFDVFKASVGTHLLPDMTQDIQQLTGLVQAMNAYGEKHPTQAGIAGKGLEVGAGLLSLAGIVKLAQFTGKTLGIPAAWNWMRALAAPAATKAAPRVISAFEAMGGRVAAPAAEAAAGAGAKAWLGPIGWLLMGAQIGKDWVGPALQKWNPLGFEVYKHPMVPYGGGSFASNPTINIYTEPGADAKELSDAMRRELDRHMGSAIEQFNQSQSRLSFNDPTLARPN